MSEPLKQAHAVAARIGASPLLWELELLAQRVRLDLASPAGEPADTDHGLEEILGLTPREAEVLALVSRGYTNREIAATLVISAKTASVHVSHILHKLGAPNRHEAAAIAHRVAPPVAKPPDSGASQPSPRSNSAALVLILACRRGTSRRAFGTSTRRDTRMRNHAIGTVKAVLLGPSPDAP